MRPARRKLLGVVAGLVAGAGAGACLLAATGVAVARGVEAADDKPSALIEATHTPPLLTLPGETPTLRYDVYCAPAGLDPESGAPCDGAGTVFVRAGDSGAFRAVALVVDATASQGRYAAAVPLEIARSASGFSYYAVLSSKTTGATTVLPAGGSLAPMRSRPLGPAITVDLGAHAFGSVRRATARAAAASWGAGPAQIGREPGPEQQPIGGSSFDVGRDGAVHLLDEAKRRVLRFAPGAATPAVIPTDVRGTIADLAVGDDGTMAVLETVGDEGGAPLVRSFDTAGRSLGVWRIAERRASSVEAGATGPVVLGYPAGQWMPVADNGAGLSAPSQHRRGRSGRAFSNGKELVVERVDNEARIAQFGPRGARRSWRISSATPLGEVQLAEPLGDKVVVVLRVYTETRDEFEVLVLDERGLARRFSVDSAAWAETAPLARFRLHASALYELGSTPAGVFVDRYDLEVR